MSAVDWQPDQLVLPVAQDVIVVWRIPLETHRPLLDTEWALLSADEHARAERFKFDEPRIRLVRCRSALRQILGRWLALDPRALRFEYGEHGKPRLMGPPAAPAFNVSHSHHWGLIALTAAGEIGVDVERIEQRDSWSGIARRFYSPCEVKTLEALHPAKQLPGFFHIWTGKEAFIKAIGRGLSFPLSGFSVQGDPDQPAQLLAIENDLTAAQQWHMQAVSPAVDYAATVIWNGPARNVVCRDVRLDDR